MQNSYMSKTKHNITEKEKILMCYFTKNNFIIYDSLYDVRVKIKTNNKKEFYLYNNYKISIFRVPEKLSMKTLK